MTLKAGSQSSSGNPARVHTWYKTVFQPLRCATWAWQGALAQKKQKRACGPHQPQPAHQVAKVDVVQILQPSTMDTGPALLTTGPHGNVRPKADPVLMLDNYFLSQRKSPSSLCVQDRGGHVLHYTLTERPWSRLSRPKVCASLCRLFSAGNSRLRTEGYLDSLSQGRGLNTNPTSELFRIPEPFNTAKVPKKTRRVAQRPTELDVMNSSMDRREWVVMSLGQLCCSQVGTRPRGAIQGH